MSKIKKLLSRVDNIVKNSQPDTLTEIKNISNILEVNGKVATVLHFVNKDSSWNPHTLTFLNDLLKEEKLTEGTDQEKMDFYLLKYLDKHWKDLVIKRLRAAKGLNFVATWLTPVVDVMVDDVTKLGLYPEIDFQRNVEKVMLLMKITNNYLVIVVCFFMDLWLIGYMMWLNQKKKMV